MTQFLKTFGDLVPSFWIPLLVVIFIVLTILTWVLPNWRGNAIGSIGGFFLSFAGIWWGCRVAATEPRWARAILTQLKLEGIQTSWLDLRPHMGRMVFAVIGGGLAYVLGMVLTKWCVRAWFRWRGETNQEATTRNTLSPFH